MAENFEVVFNEKTYTTKKMNPRRKGLILTHIVSEMQKSEETESVSDSIKRLALSVMNAPLVLWEFLKDEDKKNIGTYEAFADELDDKQCSRFTIWAMQQVKEANDFLDVESKKVAVEPQSIM